MLSRPDDKGNETQRLRNELRGKDNNVLANLVLKIGINTYAHRHLQVPVTFLIPLNSKLLSEPFNGG
jgi:hypothetical protein